MRHIRILPLLFLASAVLLTSAFSFWQLFLPALDGRAVTKATQVESAGRASRLDAGTDLFFENEVDLGTIKETTTREVSFHNRSDTIIRILGVHASCNCAKAELSKSVLEPREEARITVRIEPRPDRLGRQRYSIDLDYLGESRRTARLELRADYRPDLVVPPQLSIRSVAGRGGTASFSITDFRTVPLEFTDIQPSCPELHVHVIEKPSAYLPGWRYQLAASWNPANPTPGQYSETITLKTNYAGKETLAIPVTIQEVRRLRVVPEILFLRPCSDKAGEFEGKVIVDDSDGELVSLDCVKTSHEYLQCDCPARRARRLIIGVRLKGDRLPGEETPLTLEICTKEPVIETARVRVTAGSYLSVSQQ